ncbi:MAG: hypothetical protein NTY01_02445 [Verrucomicrobia bacterium]|nr:hypothetical protein [Verrucomicrobiota bacterium]
MRIGLFVALGGLAVIALALSLHLIMVKPVASPAPAPEPPRAVAATPHPAKLQHMLAQQSNEIRRLKKEKSALLSEIEQHVTDLAKPEPRPARASDQPAAPRMAGMSKMMAVAVRQQSEMKMAALKSRLHLTDEQAAAVQELLKKQTDQQVEMATKMFEGKLTAEDMKSRPTFDFDSQLKQVLDAEQWTGYQQFKTEEQQRQVQMASQAEVMQISSMLQLSAEQQQQVSSILQQQYQQMMSQQPNSSLPTPDSVQRVEQMFNSKKEALRAVLTPEQMQSYEKFIESQREMVKSMIPQSQPSP